MAGQRRPTLEPHAGPSIGESFESSRRNALISSARQAIGKGKQAGEKERIIIALASEILNGVDEARREMGASRVAWINACIVRGQESGLTGIRRLQE